MSAATEYTMPPVGVGDTVKYWLDPGDGSPTLGWVERVNNESVALIVLAQGLPKRLCVRHKTDPKLREQQFNRDGCWDHIDAAAERNRRLAALEAKVAEMEPILAGLK